MPFKYSSLVAALDTPGDIKAEAAIQKIVKKGKKLHPELLLAAKDNKNFRIQKWSLEALGAIGDKKANPTLLAALKDERLQIRLHALKGLARLKNKKKCEIHSNDAER